jgi:hypothetical protein
VAEHADQLVTKQSVGKLIVHLLGFAVGASLLGWCVYVAVNQGDWTRLANASPVAIVLLIASSLVSQLANGTTFWVTIRPVRRLTWPDMMMLNMLANLLNYAPLRLGALARVAYHLRVDRLPLLTIGAWFTCIAWFLVMGVGACAAATIARPHLDWLWALLLIGQMALFGALTRAFAGYHIVARIGYGAPQILTSPAALWGGLALRVVDIAAYVGRMTAAMMIVDIAMPATHVVLLALVAIIANLIPFGRLGFREMAVTIAALRLSEMGMDASGMEEFGGDSGMWAQLALIESAGEAIVAVPAGLAAVHWFRKRWRNRPNARETK